MKKKIILSTIITSLWASTAMAELKVLTNVVGGKTAEEQALFEKELEKHLGFEIDMRKPAASYDQVMLTSLASGDALDVLYITTKHLPLLVEEGALVDLTQIISDSPILSEPSAIPEAEWKLIRYDEKIFAVPAKLEGGTMPTLRQDWLEEFGLDVPVTLDDWYNYFKMCKEKKNAYGLTFKGSELYEIQGFMSAAGVKAGYVIDENGKRTVPYATEAAAEIYDWFAMLLKEGLLDPNFVTAETNDMRKMFLSDQVGAVTYWDMWVGLFNNIKLQEDPNTKFRALGVAAVPDKDGNIIMRRGDSSVWVIPQTVKNKEQAIKFLEFWHTEAGYILGTLGVEGHDYNVVDGKYVLTEEGQKHNGDHGTPRVPSTTWENPLGTLPGVEEAQAIIVEHATPEYYPAEWPDAFDIIVENVIKAIRGEMSSKDAIAKMQKDLKRKKLID